MELYTIKQYEEKPENSGNATPSSAQTRETVRDVYRGISSHSLDNSLPLVIAAYPDENGTNSTIITDPGAGELTTKYAGSQLQVTLPGSDLLVHLRGQLAWEILTGYSSETTVSCILSIVIDDTVIESGATSGNLFTGDFFTGASGVAGLENIFILRKNSTTNTLLAGGQHTIGMYFAITTKAFDTGTVSIKNASFIVQDAGFDERLKVYTP